MLNGEVGDYVTIARKDRASENWYLGAITDEQPRNLRVKLDFLTEGRRYYATIYRDGKGAGFDADGHALEINMRPVSRQDTLAARTGAGRRRGHQHQHEEERGGRHLVSKTKTSIRPRVRRGMNEEIVAASVRPELTFWQIWNMCFGFLGIQFGLALQNANVSRIFQTLGARIDEIAGLWIAAPLTGLVVQPIIGYMSDRTWNWLGRRRPYFLAGAVLASLALFLMPRSPTLWIAAGMLWMLDASINIAMEPFRAFVADQMPPRQRPAGYSMQSFFIGVGSVVASMLPYFLEKAGVSNVGDAADAVPATVRYSFYIGAAVLLGAILWTIVSSREYPPATLHAFADSTPDAEGVEPGSGARAGMRGARVDRHRRTRCAGGVALRAGSNVVCADVGRGRRGGCCC